MDLIPEKFGWEGVYEKWSYDELVAHLQAQVLKPLDENEKDKHVVIRKLMDYGIAPEGEDDGRAG